VSSLAPVAAGSQGLLVSPVGLGCMGMSEHYGAVDEHEAVATLHAALDIGVTLLDTADSYGPHRNERLLSEILSTRRHEAILATKFGFARTPEDPTDRTVDGRPEYVHRACDASLQRLGVDHIDLYFQHRIDHAVPVEETVGAMAELVGAGKVRFIGLCEVAPATIRRAHAVHPLSAVQSEYSLWSRDVERDGVLNILAELGIGLVAYSPLGRGFLSGAIGSADELDAADYRRTTPRLSPGHLPHNLGLVATLARLAAERSCTAAQLALAWVASRPGVVPIAGMRSRGHLRENVAALDVALTIDELAQIADALPAPSGERYGDAGMDLVGR
jgi:aryl-alcohol dehydrogenase-like predicted oxidoreductase